MNSITIDDIEHEIPEEVAEFIHLLARDKTRLENLLKATKPHSSVSSSEGLYFKPIKEIR